MIVMATLWISQVGESTVLITMPGKVENFDSKKYGKNAFLAQ